MSWRQVKLAQYPYTTALPCSSELQAFQAASTRVGRDPNAGGLHWNQGCFWWPSDTQSPIPTCGMPSNWKPVPGERPDTWDLGVYKLMFLQIWWVALALTFFWTGSPLLESGQGQS